MPLIKKILSFFFILVLLSCNSNRKGENTVISIGGEIINPKSQYVIISKGDCIIDSVKLAKDNTFLYSSKDLKPGLYSFRHNEYQVMYLEPGDSIMLRVNTMDFDESLTYTGVGAEKNNLLTEMFLYNETESKLMPKLYILPPAAFQKKIDSMKTERIIFYNEFKKNNTVSNNFSEVVNASIDYDYYSKKELYASAYNARERFSGPEDFPKKFYSYREDIDFNNNQLKTYYPYFLFLNRYFDNMAYEEYNGIHWFDRNSYIHNIHKMELIGNNVKDEELRNNLLRLSARRYLLNGKNAEKENDIKEFFLRLNTNEAYKKEITNLAEATIRLTPGEKIPNVLLVDVNNNNRSLRDVIKKHTVLYFWSSNSIKHYRDIHSRAAELHDRFPEYDFVAINTDSHFKNWRKTITNNGYTRSYEYQIEDINDAERKLVLNSMNKAIILDQKGRILENNANIFVVNIETLLLGHLNK